MNLSPQAYEAVQMMRRAYVEAGAAGRYGAEHWPEAGYDSHEAQRGTDGSRHCVMSRYTQAAGHSIYQHMIEIRGALRAIGQPRGLVYLNDHVGYEATVEVLDQLITDCTPATTLAEIEVVA
jgi:hypothetical protein